MSWGHPSSPHGLAIIVWVPVSSVRQEGDTEGIQTWRGEDDTSWIMLNPKGSAKHDQELTGKLIEVKPEGHSFSRVITFLCLSNEQRKTERFKNVIFIYT